MNTPKVSIAIATYNGEKYLDEQLKSIFEQTHVNIEVIACDDCSTDGTIQILERYCRYTNFKYFLNNKNLGYVKNFQKVISMCSGDFIALCDQDDIWMPTKIEELLENIGDNLCIHSDAFLINNDSEIISESYSQYSSKLTMPESMYDLAFNGCVTGCTALFSRELLNDLLPFPQNLDVHDRWIGALAFSKGRLKYIDKSLIKYRQHENNNIGAANVNLNLSKMILNWFSKNRKILFKKNGNFENVYRRHHAFVGILLERFPSNFSYEEKRNLYKLLKIYEGFMAGGVYSLINFFKYIKYFHAVELNKNLGYKVLFYCAIFREVLLRCAKKNS